MISGLTLTSSRPSTPIGLDDAADVGLHGGALQAAARLGLDDRRKVGVLDPLVALERDASSTGASCRCTISRSPARSIVTLSNRSGRDQRLQRRIARGLIEASVGRGMKIRAHGRRRRCGGCLRRRWSRALLPRDRPLIAGVGRRDRSAIAASQRPGRNRARYLVTLVDARRRMSRCPALPQPASKCAARAKQCRGRGEMMP